MPNLPVPNVAQANMRFTTEAQPWECLFHIQYSGAGGLSSTDLASLALEVYDTFTVAGGLMDAVSTTTVATECEVVDLDAASIGSAIHTGSATGTNTHTNLPMNACAVISWKLPTRYRGGKPRTYLSGMTEDNLANVNQFTTAFQAALVTRAAAFLSSINSATFGTRTGKLCTVGRTRKGILQTPPIVNQISGSSVRQQVRTQRRRLGV